MREAGRRQVTLLVVGEGELGLHDVVIKARRRGLRGEMPTSSVLRRRNLRAPVILTPAELVGRPSGSTSGHLSGCCRQATNRGKVRMAQEVNVRSAVLFATRVGVLRPPVCFCAGSVAGESVSATCAALRRFLSSLGYCGLSPTRGCPLHFTLFLFFLLLCWYALWVRGIVGQFVAMRRYVLSLVSHAWLPTSHASYSFCWYALRMRRIVDVRGSAPVGTRSDLR